MALGAGLVGFNVGAAGRRRRSGRSRRATTGRICGSRCRSGCGRRWGWAWLAPAAGGRGRRDGGADARGAPVDDAQGGALPLSGEVLLVAEAAPGLAALLERMRVTWQRVGLAAWSCWDGPVAGAGSGSPGNQFRAIVKATRPAEVTGAPNRGTRDLGGGRLLLRGEAHPVADLRLPPRSGVQLAMRDGRFNRVVTFEGRALPELQAAGFRVIGLEGRKTLLARAELASRQRTADAVSAPTRRPARAPPPEGSSPPPRRTSRGSGSCARRRSAPPSCPRPPGAPSVPRG